jgi:hypothetical protein
MTTDIEIIDSIAAYSVEAGDQIVIEGDLVEVTFVGETEDIDEVFVIGYSHESGDRVEYPLFADDMFDVWSV